jgi:uncharacterized protein involved in exopolysaccharide biosynthesis
MLNAPNVHHHASPGALDERPETIRGVFEPPSGFVVSAISRHRIIVVCLAILLAVLSAGLGLKRKTTYTASATLQVGQVNPNSPGFYGYVQSSASLATAFSRSITSESVLRAVQEKLKLAPLVAASRLSAEPLPQAPAFRVIATGPTEHAAVALANVGANAVVSYESQTNSTNPQAASLLGEYRSASVNVHRAIDRVEHLTRIHGTPTNALLRAQAEKDTTETALRAIEAAYTAAVTSEAPRTGLVTLLAGATTASSDGGSKVQLFGFIGLLAGVVLGCAAAVVLERRRISRGLGAVTPKMPRSETA